MVCPLYISPSSCWPNTHVIIHVSLQRIILIPLRAVPIQLLTSIAHRHTTSRDLYIMPPGILTTWAEHYMSTSCDSHVLLTH